MSNYPLGADNDSRAPYNQKENPEIEVTLEVGYSIGKVIKVKTSDYELDEFVDVLGPNFDNTDISTLVQQNCPPPEGWNVYDTDFSIV